MEFVTNIKCYLARQAKSTQPGGYQVKKREEVREHDKTAESEVTQRIEKEIERESSDFVR